MVSNIESVAREIGEQIPEVAEVQQKTEQALNADVAVANPMAKDAVEMMNPAETEEMEADKAAEAKAEVAKAEEAKAAEVAKAEEAKAVEQAKQAAEEKVKTKPQTETTKKKNSWDCIPETMPYFPGGQELLLKYLAANIKYPASAVKAKMQGRVIV